MMDESFWDRLKARIQTQNTTQEWVANIIGVPFGTFRKWMSRKTMPNADQAYSIAKTLDTTVEWLVGGEEGLQYLRGRPELSPVRMSDSSIKLANDISKLSDSDREELEALIALKLAREEAKKARHA
jgi:transcriptional regulator with XRE-family HTH domain